MVGLDTERTYNHQVVYNNVKWRHAISKEFEEKSQRRLRKIAHTGDFQTIELYQKFVK
jgi:hypothetical protein